VKLRWTHGARDDLMAIAEFIAKDNESAARRWIQRLRRQAERAIRLPRSGRMVQEFGRSDLREFIHSGYRIVYLVRESDVVVVSVFEGHRGLRLTEADMRTADE